MTWTYSRKVKYYETDRMGVVHHSNYLRILEDARMDWVDENVISYSALEKMGIIIPFIESHGKFLSFLRFGDSFTVPVKLIAHSGVRFTFYYEIYNDETGVLCYKGTTSHYYAADGDYHPISLKRTHPDLYEKMELLTEPGQDMQLSVFHNSFTDGTFFVQ